MSRSTEAAARMAAQEAMEGHAAGEPVDVCLVFATAPHDQARMLEVLREEVNPTLLVGCSGEGIITPGASDERDHAIGVMTLRAPEVQFSAALLENYGEDSRAAGRALADEVAKRPGTRCVVLLPDGLSGNCEDFLEEAAEYLPPDVLLAGGTAADEMRFEAAFQYMDDRVISGGCAALFLGGEIDAEVAVSHGCLPIGLERTITDAEGGWLHKIDDQPAWSVFKEYLDGEPEDLNADGILHLCVGAQVPDADQAYGPLVIRTPMKLDKESGSLFFPGGGLNTGDRIQITRRDPGTIRASAERCASSLQAVREDAPLCMFQFDCAGRGRALFGNHAADEIVAPLQNAFPKRTPWLGFHTYGEIAPLGRRAHYHNYTVALLALYPRSPD